MRLSNSSFLYKADWPLCPRLEFVRRKIGIVELNSIEY